MKGKIKNVNYKKLTALVLCGTLFVTSTLDLFSTIYDYKEAKFEYEELSELCTYEIGDNYGETTEEQSSSFEEEEANLMEKIVDFFIPSAISEEKKENPYIFDKEVTSPVADISKIKFKGINWTKLKEINPDVVAWISQPNTVIDYPIVQGDDNSYYLTNSFKKKKSSAGTIFLNYLNNDSLEDDISMIYGHHMKNGEMFYSVNKYQKQSYYNKNKYMIVYTTDNIYLLEIFAGVKVKGDEYIPVGNFNSKEEFDQFVNDAVEKSTFKSDISVSSGDKILGLCTCTYEEDNLRFIVYGKLIPLCKENKKNNSSNTQMVLKKYRRDVNYEEHKIL